MLFLPNFTEIKGMASSLNPLNVFAEPQTQSPTTTTPVTSTSNGHTAEAGPGPSTQASQSRPAASTLKVPNGQSRARPSLKGIHTPSMSSLEDEEGRRRSSGTSVMFAEDGEGEQSLGVPVQSRLRNERPLSGASKTTTGSAEPRRRKKSPLDTYCIVRPPPTASKNPLNLQIQLVVKEPKGTRDRSTSSAISVRSSSVATNTTASTPSVPVTPTSDNVDLPPTSSPALEGDFSSSSGSKSRSESPSPMSGEYEGDRRNDGAELKRSSSLRSNVSSNISSASNYAGGSRKRVEPMFNLAVHNVMQPTVVTDAATDVKVAKFLKRSLDVSGVGILEPAEVWLPPAHQPHMLSPFTSRAEDANSKSRPLSIVSLTAPLSPTATRLTDGNNRHSLDLSTIKRSSIDFRNLRIGDPAQEGGRTKKFFGKMFKKQSTVDVPPPRSAMVDGKPRTSSSSSDRPLGILKVPSQTASIAQDHVVPGHALGHATFGTAPLVVHRRSSGTIVTPDGAVTGLTALTSTADNAIDLSSSPPSSEGHETCTALPMMPSSRPVGYTWTVRKWAKKNTEGWGAHLVAAAAAGLEFVNGSLNGDGEDEVIFEWVKLRVPSNAVGSSIMSRYSASGSLAASAVKSKLAPPRDRSRPPSVKDLSFDPNDKSSLTVRPDVIRSASNPPSPNPSIILDPRPHPVRRVSTAKTGSPLLLPSRQGSISPPSDHEADHDVSSIHTAELTAEEDSDPEDSETPWTCSVWVKKTGQRQLLGTLTPAPHHPKVIGVLKIPMKLDSVSLTDVKGKEGEKAHEELAHRVKEEVCLTEENLKDVVCVTAMWLVAREEFGGLGRKKRGSSKV